ARQFAEMALPDLTRAIELDPKRAEFRVVRGAAYQLYIHNAEHALADYGAAIDLEPDNANYLVERGKMYVELQEPQLAIVDFDRAAALGHAGASDFAQQIR